MCKCCVCDCILTDREATYKDENGEYLDTCESCLFDEDFIVFGESSLDDYQDLIPRDYPENE